MSKAIPTRYTHKLDLGNTAMVMKTYRFLARQIMAPILDLLRGTKTMKCLRELEQSQWWPREKILELQNQRLKQLVRYAYDNVPYYHRIFDERGLEPEDIETSKDLVKLPVLTKQIIRANFDDLTAQNFPAKELVKLATGGSTGEPLVFYDTMYDHITLSFAARQRVNSGMGYELGDKYARLATTPAYQSKKERLWQAPISFFRRDFFVDIKDMTKANMPVFAERLERFQPGFIVGYPSAIYELARFIKMEGKMRLKPKAIITGAEQLYDYQRGIFREVFGCDTFECYGSQEQHLIAFECRQHSGYHVVAENVVVEIVDNEGKVVPAGNEGRILITNLHNYAMPFIRYEIRDVGAGSERACHCGRGLPLLSGLKGRTTDSISTRSKGTIPSISLPWSFLAGWGVEQFQIVQDAYDKVVVKLVLKKDIQEKDMGDLSSEIVAQYKRILGQDMDVAVEYVEQIPINAAGKRRFVVSNLPPRDSVNS